MRQTEAAENPAVLAETGCVIMASGLGQRFGSNKLMADFGGAPMLARVLAATDFLQRRVVVTRHPDVADWCRRQGIAVVLHELPFRSDTVRLGLQALPGVERCLFCPGDQPLLTRTTVAALVRLSGEHPGDIVRPAVGGEPGAPVLFPARFFPELAALPQGKGGGYVAKRHPESVRLLPIENAGELADADTPETLAALLAQAGEG